MRCRCGFGNDFGCRYGSRSCRIVTEFGNLRVPVGRAGVSVFLFTDCGQSERRGFLHHHLLGYCVRLGWSGSNYAHQFIVACDQVSILVQIADDKFGSLSHTDRATRRQAIDHNLECIEIGKSLGSKALSIWIGDGSNFPGQTNFTWAFERYVDAVKEIARHLPDDWHVFLEHEWKAALGIPREVNMYAVIPVGWPMGRFGPVSRRAASEVIHRDRW